MTIVCKKVNVRYLFSFKETSTIPNFSTKLVGFGYFQFHKMPNVEFPKMLTVITTTRTHFSYRESFREFETEACTCYIFGKKELNYSLKFAAKLNVIL